MQRSCQMTGDDHVESAEFLGRRIGLRDSLFAEIDVGLSLPSFLDVPQRLAMANHKQSRGDVSNSVHIRRHVNAG